MSEVQAPQVDAPVESAEPVIPRHRVKVDGNEVEVDLEELKRGYSHQQAANKILQEGKTARQQAEQLVQLLKSDPLAVLKDPRLGLNVRKLAEEYLAAEIGDELMDPKDKELRDLKRWKEEREGEANRAKEEEENARQQELRSKYVNDYSASIVEVLEAGGLPKNPVCVKRMAYYMQEGLKRGIELSPRDVVPLVKEDYMEEQKALFGSADGDSLLSLLGEDVAAKIRKHDLSRLKSSGTISTKKAAPRAQVHNEKPKGLTKDEFRALIRSQL